MKKFVLIVQVLLLALGLFSGEKDDMRFYNVIPFYEDDLEYVAQRIRKMNPDLGVKRAAVCLRSEPLGFPAYVKRNQHVETYKKLAEMFRDDKDVELGVLIQSTIGHFRNHKNPKTAEPWQHMVLFDGKEISSMCVLDREFQKYTVETFVQLAKCNPAFLLIDDDFSVRRNECACPLHLAAYSKAFGREITQPEIQVWLNEPEKYRAELEKIKRVRWEGLLQLATEIRAGINTVNPKLRCGICCHEISPAYVKLAKNLAGDTEPFIRIPNAYYLERTLEGVPWVAWRTALARKTLKDVRELIDESDTFPQSRFSESATALHAHLTEAILGGLRGAKLWVNNFVEKDPLSGVEYEKIIKRNIGFYNELLRLVDSGDGISWRGIGIPLWNLKMESFFTEKALSKNDFLRAVLWRFGVPIYYDVKDNSPIIALAGNQCDKFSDEEIRQLMSRKVLLDSVAVKKLCSRGFSDLIGVDCGDETEIKFMKYEVNADDTKGVWIGWNKDFACLRPKQEAKILTKLYDKNVNANLGNTKQRGSCTAASGVPIGVGATVFDNQISGRVVALTWGIDSIAQHDLCRLERKDMLLYMIDALRNGGNDFPVCADELNVMLRYGKLKDDKFLLIVYDLTLDPMDEVTFFDGSMPKKVERLDCDGSWKVVEISKTATGWSIKTPVQILSPCVLRLTR